MRAGLVLALAAALCGCAKVEELWSRIDPVTPPDPPPAVPEPAALPPSMPRASAARGTTSADGDRPADDRIMSLGLRGQARSSPDGARQLWDPAPGRTGQAGPAQPQAEERPPSMRRVRAKGKAAPRARAR